MSCTSNPNMESSFKQRFAEICNGTKVHANFSKEVYFNLVDEVKNAASKDATKTNREYYILSKYVAYSYAGYN